MEPEEVLAKLPKAGFFDGVASEKWKGAIGVEALPLDMTMFLSLV